MRAAQITRFGGSDVLTLVNVDTPAPEAGEVRVAVGATSVNSYDTMLRAGKLTIVSGRKFPIGIGLDFVGTVDAVGDGVTGFQVGDRVWGQLHPQQKHRLGSAAEYVVAAADRLAAAPTSVSDAGAASLVVAGVTAQLALDTVRIMPGQRLLVRGAAGGVGTAVVQLDHHAGATVTAIASARTADTVAALGADTVLDRASATSNAVGLFDAIIDLVGSELLSWHRALAPSGRMVTAALTGAAITAIGLSVIHGARRIRTFNANPTTKMLEALTASVDRGNLRPVIASEHPLVRIRAAHHAFEAGGVVGKHIVTIAH
ncbi:NADP-dependent oxidoreductase [Curtobacterium sp. 1P10AnD]|uniref:quinone oxidoreductase family protein n=1 Tax=Curtobacterium sp. 1P10AnD TaxID=3132283 RepID=UPI0039A11D1E